MKLFHRFLIRVQNFKSFELLEVGEDLIGSNQTREYSGSDIDVKPFVYTPKQKGQFI